MNRFVLQYEILLCVQDQDDPAVDVCKKLLGKYPNVDARLFIGERTVLLFSVLTCSLFFFFTFNLWGSFVIKFSFNDIKQTFGLLRGG